MTIYDDSEQNGESEVFSPSPSTSYGEPGYCLECKWTRTKIIDEFMAEHNILNDSFNKMFLLNFFETYHQLPKNPEFFR